MNDYIGNNIKKARIRAGFTQEKLAEQVNVSLSVISRLETGRTMVSVAKLIKIADALGTFAGYFFMEPEFADCINGLTSEDELTDHICDINEASFLQASEQNITPKPTASSDPKSVESSELYQLIEQLPDKGREFFKKSLLSYLEVF